MCHRALCDQLFFFYSLLALGSDYSCPALIITNSFMGHNVCAVLAVHLKMDGPHNPAEWAALCCWLNYFE